MLNFLYFCTSTLPSICVVPNAAVSAVILLRSFPVKVITYVFIFHTLCVSVVSISNLESSWPAIIEISKLISMEIVATLFA